MPQFNDVRSTGDFYRLAGSETSDTTRKPSCPDSCRPGAEGQESHWWSGRAAGAWSLFDAANATTTRIHAGNVCRNGTASITITERIGHLKPSMSTNTTAVETSRTHWAGGNSITQRPAKSEMPATKSAHRQGADFQAKRKLWTSLPIQSLISHQFLMHRSVC